MAPFLFIQPRMLAQNNMIKPTAASTEIVRSKTERHSIMGSHLEGGAPVCNRHSFPENGCGACVSMNSKWLSRRQTPLVDAQGNDNSIRRPTALHRAAQLVDHRSLDKLAAEAGLSR